MRVTSRSIKYQAPPLPLHNLNYSQASKLLIKFCYVTGFIRLNGDRDIECILRSMAKKVKKVRSDGTLVVFGRLCLVSCILINKIVQTDHGEHMTHYLNFWFSNI